MLSSSESTCAVVPSPRWDHQQKAFDFAKDRESTLIHVKMGGGKTKTVIDLFEEWKAQSILVIAPLSVIDENGWLRQFKIHGQRDYLVQPCVKISVAKRVEKAKQAHEKAKAWGRPFVLVVNYDSCWRKPMDTYLKSVHWDVACLDEIHRIASADAKSSMFCYQLRQHVNKKLGMSGTPMRHSPLDIFGQFRFLDPTLFGLNYTYFKQTYARTLIQVKRRRLEELTMLKLNDMAKPEDLEEIEQIKDFVSGRDKQRRLEVLLKLQEEGVATEHDVAEIGQLREALRNHKHTLNNVVIAYKNQEQLNEKYYRVAFRAGDVDLHLPEVLHETRSFDLSEEARKAHDDIKSTLVAQIEAGEINAANALVASQRLQQITGGSVPVDDGTRVIIDRGKSLLLDELFEDSEPTEPWVVFAWYTEDLARIAEAAQRSGREYYELSGRKKQLNEWQNAKGGDVLGVQIASGSLGMDATRARYCAIYSFRGSVADYDQMLARVHRPGQTRPVTYYYLVARNSIDSKVYRTIRNRRELIDEILSLIVDRNTDNDVLED